MRNTFKNIGLSVVLGLSLASCDSTPDAVTPAVVPSTFEFLWVKAPNAATGNSGLWNLKKEVTTGATFTPPANVLSNDFATLSATIPTATLVANQCSAYDKVSKRYVVSSGERVVVYNFNTISGVPVIEFQHAVSNVEAMEFANGRFFFIKNNILREGDITTATPITSFAPITLATGQVSNLTQKGDYLSVISGGHLYVFNITLASPVILDDSTTLASGFYEGLEAINSPGAPLSLYVVKRNGTVNELQDIKLNVSSTVATVISNTTKHTLSTSFPVGCKISSALDYTTEFYYVNSPNDAIGTSNSITSIDLTPTNPSTYLPSFIPLSANNYAFGLQLKD
jgi:hypothetical protein